MPVTIREVAKQLNLSITTVSRALDGYSDVSEATRKRVAQVAHELGYLPNRAARQLRRQRTDTIGYILPTVSGRSSGPSFAEFITAIAGEAALNNFDLLFSTAPADSDAEQQEYVRWVCEHRVGGFVLDGVRPSDWRIRYLHGEKIPFTSLERSVDELDYPTVHLEGINSTISLVDHLITQGYQHIAYLGSNMQLTIEHDRYSGYCQGLVKHSIPFFPTMVMQVDLTIQGGYQAARQMLLSTNPPDAFICSGDETAFGVLQAAYDLHVLVGDGIGIAVFDGGQSSVYSHPSLTTLDQPISEIVRQLVRMLLAEIHGESLPVRYVEIEPELHIRRSTIKGDPV